MESSGSLRAWGIVEIVKGAVSHHVSGGADGQEEVVAALLSAVLEAEAAVEGGVRERLLPSEIYDTSVGEEDLHMEDVATGFW